MDGIHIESMALQSVPETTLQTSLAAAVRLCLQKRIDMNLTHNDRVYLIKIKTLINAISEDNAFISLADMGSIQKGGDDDE